MITQTSDHLEPADHTGLCHWPHKVVMLPTSQQHGITSTTGEDFNRNIVREFTGEIKKRNQSLKLAGRQETVLCTNIIENIPQSSELRDELWRAIKKAQCITFIAVVKDPAIVTELLPGDWGDCGYKNVCVVLETCNAVDRNRENIAIFAKLPARFHALWIEPRSSIDNWNDKIDWIIVDTSAQDFHGGLDGGLSDKIVKWVEEFRLFSASLKIPYFHNPPGEADTDLVKQSNFSDHPFSQEIDLHRPPLATPSSARDTDDLSGPTSVEDTQVDSPVVAPPSATLQTAGDSNLSMRASTNDVGKALVGSIHKISSDSKELRVVTTTPMENAASDKRARFVELDQIARRGLQAFFIAGQAMMEIHDAELWREGDHISWDSYCISVLGMTKSYANRIIKSAQIAHQIRHAKTPRDSEGEPIHPVSESQARPLARLESQGQRLKAWKVAVKRANGLPTAATVTYVVRELLAENSPPKSDVPSRKERREKLVCELCEAAAAEASWETVRSIAASLKLLCS